MTSRVLFFVCAASLIGCGGADAGESVDESSASATTEAAPIDVFLGFNPNPNFTMLATNVWSIPGQQYVTYTAYISDGGTLQPVTTGGYVQFYICYGLPTLTTCSDRFTRFGNPVAVNANGQASIQHLPSWNENAFVYYKYLPRGSGYKRATSDTYRTVTGSPP